MKRLLLAPLLLGLIPSANAGVYYYPNYSVKDGVKTLEKPESLTIFGSEVAGGCSIDSELDHRIAMSFLILGLISKKPIKGLRPSTIETSFPNFYKIMIELGANFTKA